MHLSPRGHCPFERKSLHGGLLGSPDGDVPLFGGFGVVVLAVLAGEGLRGEDGEGDLGFEGLFSLLGFGDGFPLGVEALLAPPLPSPCFCLFKLPGGASPVLGG